MITYSRLGKKGNIGNQLFQIASTIGIATKHGHSFSFPKWKYSKYFEKSLPISDESVNFIELKEKTFKYHSWPITNDFDYDINGWIQSEKYFDINKVREYFNFKHEYKQNVIKKYSYLFINKSILISIRRGDFVNNPQYYQLSYRYYFLALIKNFPDWKDRNLIFLSDDISYCKKHFSHLKNSFYIENLDAMDQLVISTQCNDFIISNSTFSWWLAWFGERKKSIVIRPIYNFGKDFINQNIDSDYFPKRWMAFDERNYNINLKYFNLVILGEYYEIKFKVKSKIKTLKKYLKQFFKIIYGK